jgi:DivIVA domain-containing protein
MTPDEIRSQRFAVQLVRGFSRAEVSAFLLDVADAYEDLHMANASLIEQVKALAAEAQMQSARPVSSAPAGEHLHATESQAKSAAETGRGRDVAAPGHIEVLRAAALREVEALLHDAQAQADAMIEGAREREAALLQDAQATRARLQTEADSILTGAVTKADSLIADARDREAAIRAEIDRLIESRLNLVDDIRGTLDTYRQWLATVDPRGPSRDWRDNERDNELSDGDHDADDVQKR